MFTMLSIWPSTVEGWVGLIILFCSLIGSIAALVPTLIKLFKSLKEIVKNRDWKKVLKLADIAIKKAEETGLPGSDKLHIVMETVQEECVELGIKVDQELLDNLEEYIRETIEWFNDMNAANKAGKKAAKAAKEKV